MAGWFQEEMAERTALCHEQKTELSVQVWAVSAQVMCGCSGVAHQVKGGLSDHRPLQQVRNQEAVSETLPTGWMAAVEAHQWTLCLGRRFLDPSCLPR